MIAAANPTRAWRLTWIALLTAWSAFTFAQTAESENWNAKFQSTYVWQRKNGFAAAYSGAHSLSAQREKSYSFTATAAFGYRPWQGGELYFNPEVAQGIPLSGLSGLGGFTNGEIARTAGSNPTFYRARLFLRQSWGDAGSNAEKAEKVDSDANQLGGFVNKRRWVLTAGNLSVIDIFDDNDYSHDPRTQFLNWSIMTHGAFDYAADARGYSWGMALERYHDDWVLRAARFIQPREPNKLSLDPAIGKHYGDQIEIEHKHAIAGQTGKLRVLAFRNVAKMSNFDDAIRLGLLTATTPDINAVRTREQAKVGMGINLEQALTPDVGLFARASWADGKTETYAFTEIDRSVSGGLLVKGNAWGRGMDTVGVALAQNGLSNARRNYLALGGLGFFIGDGRIRYRAENIFEVFYNLRIVKNAWLSLDYQHIRNPAYNADRGPVNVVSMRLHTEF